MNTFLNHVYERITDNRNYLPQEGDVLPVLVVVEVLKEQNLITYEDYHLFITDERSYGSVQGIIKDYQFTFSSMNFEDVEPVSGIPEDEMYYRVFKLINAELLEMKKRGLRIFN